MKERTARIALGLTAAAFAATATTAPAVHAQIETRTIVDLELLAIRKDAPGNERSHIAVAAPALGFPSGVWVPYAGGAVGFFTLQIRLGILWMPEGLLGEGIVARLEARPQLVNFFCGEPAVFGNLGVGYRWPLESGPVLVPGPALYVMPSLDMGPAWIRRGCPGKSGVPLDPQLFVGGAGAVGLDF